jgi:hypothetical protein
MLGVAVFTLGVSLGLSQAALAASALDPGQAIRGDQGLLGPAQPDNYKDPALVNGPVSWSICSMEPPNG